MSEESNQLTDAPADNEGLKQKLALALTDNEILSKQNSDLQEKMTTANRVSQETASLSALLHTKCQRLEMDNAELGKQNAFLRERMEHHERQVADLMKRIEILKSLEKVPPTRMRPCA